MREEDRKHSSGHYHLELQDETSDDPEAGDLYYNDSFDVIAEIIEKRTETILSLSFQCAFGCGVSHELSNDELIRMGVVKTWAGFVRLSDSYTQCKIPCLVLPSRRAAVTLIELNKRFLCSQRISDDDTNSLWQFVGGKQCFDETPQQSARREVVEETGIRETLVGDFGPLCSGVAPNSQHGPTFVDFFLLHSRSVHSTPVCKEPHKNTEWIWLTPWEIVTRPHFPLMDLALKTYLELNK